MTVFALAENPRVFPLKNLGFLANADRLNMKPFGSENLDFLKNLGFGLEREHGKNQLMRANT